MHSQEQPEDKPDNGEGYLAGQRREETEQEHGQVGPFTESGIGSVGIRRITALTGAGAQSSGPHSGECGPLWCVQLSADGRTGDGGSSSTRNSTESTTNSP